MTIQTYWHNFRQQNKLPLETNYYESFYFGSEEESASQLLSLVLKGDKTATSSAQEAYIINNEREPQVGDYSIVTDFSGSPKCIIKTLDILKLKFKDMTYDICKLEGEDLTLQTWQEKHIDFFKTVGQKNGYTFDWDMLIIFEKFEVVYK